MTEAVRTKIGVVFGGRSSEHEISILSAASLLGAINREKYDPIPFAIDKAGAWHLIESDLTGLSELSDARLVSLFEGARRVTVADFDGMTDFAFPLLHGPYGEDGTIQGLLEMLDKPYAGCGVAASALSMDKIFTKEVWIRAGIPVCAHAWTTDYACENEAGLSAEVVRIAKELPFPVFVKPANMGSSVGVSKAYDPAALKEAIKRALRYDKRVIVEETVVGRELEVGVLGNGALEVSAVGEILTSTDYYDYYSKYHAGGASLAIPADIPSAIRGEIEALALRACRALGGEGFVRIDLFYDENAGRVFFSEMNAIPGFTRYSMFPLLWRKKGVSYGTLIEKIIGLGYERHHTAHHRQSASRT